MPFPQARCFQNAGQNHLPPVALGFYFALQRLGKALGLFRHRKPYLFQRADFNHAFPVGGFHFLLKFQEALAQGVQEGLELLAIVRA